MNAHLQNRLIDIAVAGGVIVGAGFLLVWLGKKAAEKVADAGGNLVSTVGKVVEPVNPASDRNIVYRGVSSVADWLDDGKVNDSTTLGSSIYDWLN